ncbi:hypothetical protein DFR57_107226 [Saliterribacillus persicus]|uniref:Uncharacterized protein n=1 Tax=Saliterribacillus persicus TaxID=930114 RepID=A0A368XRP6_9BACI|nr:hypothetical protein DFR57_107226 [Saliterribacillus persicus]
MKFYALLTPKNRLEVTSFFKTVRMSGKKPLYFLCIYMYGKEGKKCQVKLKIHIT